MLATCSLNYPLLLYADEFKPYYLILNRSSNDLFHFALLVLDNGVTRKLCVISRIRITICTRVQADGFVILLKCLA